MKRVDSTASTLHSAEGARHQGRGRRLRHGVLQPQLSAEVPDRLPQDRPVVHPPDQHGRERHHHRDRGDRDGAQPEAAGHRRGRRDGRGADVPAGTSVRRGAGLLLQPAGAPEQFAELLESGISERMFRQSIIERQTILETQFRWVHELLERSGPLDVEDEDDETHAVAAGQRSFASPPARDGRRRPSPVRAWGGEGSNLRPTDYESAALTD